MFKELLDNTKGSGPQQDLFRQFYQEEMLNYPPPVEDMDENELLNILKREKEDLRKLQEELKKLQSNYEDNPNNKKKRERVLLEKLIRLQAFHPEITLLGREIANFKISLKNEP